MSLPDFSKFYSVSSSNERNSSLTRDDIELELKKEELESIRQDRRQRGKFSVSIFIFMGSYLLLVLVVLVLSGVKVLSISDAVLISLLSSTTADVIGIFIIVAKYLFYHKE